MSATGAGFRRMTIVDLQRVAEIAASLPHAPHWPLAVYQTALEATATPQRIALVAPECGEVAAFVVAALVPPEAEIETIAVAAESQRRGVARRLFAGLLSELKAAAVSELLLEVRASNLPALEFYRSLGFEQSGCRPGYYANPVEDALLMQLKIAR